MSQPDEDVQSQSEKNQRWQFSLARLLVAMTLAGVVIGVYSWTGRATGSAFVGVAIVSAAMFLTPNLRKPFFVILICLYSPFVWLPFIEFPTVEHKWFWISMWPSMPGIVPRVLLFRDVSFTIGNFAMAMTTLALLPILVFVASRGKWYLATTALATFTFSVVCTYLVARSFSH